MGSFNIPNDKSVTAVNSHHFSHIVVSVSFVFLFVGNDQLDGKTNKNQRQKHMLFRIRPTSRLKHRVLRVLRFRGPHLGIFLLKFCSAIQKHRDTFPHENLSNTPQCSHEMQGKQLWLSMHGISTYIHHKSLAKLR